MSTELVIAIVACLTAMSYLIKKLIDFFIKIVGEKLEKIFKAISKQAEAQAKLADLTAALLTEIRKSNDVLTKHMKDTQVHIRPEDRQILKELNQS